MWRDSSDRLRPPVRIRGSPPRRSPARRERSRERYKSSRRDESPVRVRDSSPAREMPRSTSEPQEGRSPPERERIFAHVKSSRREKSPSASPRTKRLRKAQAERGSEKALDNDRSEERGTHEGRGVKKMAERERERTKVKLDRKLPQNDSDVTDRDYERNHERGSDRNGHRERGVDRDADNQRKERRSRRDDIDGKSSRARHGRSISPVDHHGRSRHKSRSPQPVSCARELEEITDARRSERGNSEDDSVARMKAAEEALAAQQKQQPSFELSGKLAAETNRVKGVTLLFNEPPDARKPDLRWQLFVFKNGEMLNDPLYIHRQSCYLFGRERRVADVPTDHPSCSKQHAVLQFRQVTNERPDGTTNKKVKPYLMDLGSTNKTFINDSPMEPQRYYELFEKDTIKFGNSSREYVLLHENSAA